MSKARTIGSDLQTPRRVILLANTGTIVLAFGAFWLSYLSLQDLARLSGLPAGEAWVWPLIVDGVIVEATAAVVALRRAGTPARVFAWSLLCAGAGVSVIANITHALLSADARVPAAVAALVSSVPPLVLLAMTHLTVLLTGNTAPAANRTPGAVRARPREFTTHPTGRENLRVQALQLHSHGMPKRQIAAQLGVHPTTVGRWLNTPNSTRISTEEDQP